MVKPLTFKGDKSKKRKRREATEDQQQHHHHRESKSSRSTNTTTDPSRPDAAAADDVDEDAAAVATADDQSWVSADVPGDINGPVLIVLPSDPPTCLACDAHGKVFASEVENMIEGDPRTAEPHDVRQVWVATKVAGTESISFKGHHGKYLGCDKYGILSANANAISTFESFRIIQPPDTPGMFALQTHAGDGEKFIAVKEKGSGKSGAVEIRGDATSIAFESTLRIRMQARYKPKVKATKESKAWEKVTRRELEAAVGRRLEEHEVKRLKRARKEGNYHEEVLDMRARGKHDKYA